MHLSYPSLNLEKVTGFLIGYGLLIEILQHYLPTNRSFDMFDALFDSFGAFAGSLLFYGFIKKRLNTEDRKVKN